MNIKEDYVSFEVAKLLKEKGFDEPCRSYYIGSSGRYSRCAVEIKVNDCRDDEILRPTHQMACKWLREEKKVCISIDLNYSDNSFSFLIEDMIGHRIVGHGIGDTYEEAVQNALETTLKNLIL